MSVRSHARITFLIAVFAWLSVAPAQAVTIWDEAVDGDLSDQPASPTNVGSLSIGDNSLIGALVDEHDYFSFEVLAGETLDSVTVVSQTLVNNPSPNFYLIETASPISGAVVGALSWFGGNVQAGDDLFANPNFFNPGFSSPLGAGFYSVVFAGYGYEIAAYNFNLHVSGPSTEVPEPTTTAMVITGLFGLVGCSIFRSNRKKTN